MDCYWTKMANETRRDYECLERKIEELQAQYKSTKTQHLLKKISQLKELRDEARLNMRCFEKRAAQYQANKDVSA